MNPDNLGPPGGVGATPDAEPHHHQCTNHPTNEAKGASDYSRPPRRQCRCNAVGRWRYAESYQDVFRRGALDALRCAARAVDDPEVWVVLDDLAERYSDEYGLVR